MACHRLLLTATGKHASFDSGADLNSIDAVGDVPEVSEALLFLGHVEDCVVSGNQLQGTSTQGAPDLLLLLL